MKRVARHPMLSASRLFIRFLELPNAVRRQDAAITKRDPRLLTMSKGMYCHRTPQAEVFQELGPAFHASAGVFTAANIPGLSLLTALVPKTVVRRNGRRRFRMG